MHDRAAGRAQGASAECHSLGGVAISRASDDARIYTNNAETLGQRLATDVSKTSALSLRQTQGSIERANQPDRGISPDISNDSHLSKWPEKAAPEIELPTFGISL